MIAQRQGGIVVNADALQVFDGWRILTARPNAADTKHAPHHLYGHVPHDQSYSVGHWLRDVKPLLWGQRPIIVGGTGLYFSALTEGLADIPATSAEVRSAADALPLPELLSQLDARTAQQIDTKNRARVQRAWEVLNQTGQSLADWQDQTPPPLVPLASATALLLDAPKDWLTPRIEQRFDLMVAQGVMEEARAMHANWDPTHPSSKAIGAPELMEFLNGTLSFDQVKEAVIIATRQYAKRQRTWFNKRMRDWHKVTMPMGDAVDVLKF